MQQYRGLLSLLPVGSGPPWPHQSACVFEITRQQPMPFHRRQQKRVQGRSPTSPEEVLPRPALRCISKTHQICLVTIRRLSPAQRYKQYNCTDYAKSLLQISESYELALKRIYGIEDTLTVLTAMPASGTLGAMPFVGENISCPLPPSQPLDAK